MKAIMHASERNNNACTVLTLEEVAVHHDAVLLSDQLCVQSRGGRRGRGCRGSFVVRHWRLEHPAGQQGSREATVAIAAREQVRNSSRSSRASGGRRTIMQVCGVKVSR
jgi:hypothetical protein